jgi:hypothetical protein
MASVPASPSRGASYRDPEVEDLLPSAFLKRVMLDEAAPLPARIMCAAKVIPFVERRPTPNLPNAIPLFREWTDEQFDDFERRTREDMRQNPRFYAPGFFQMMNEPWPAQQTKLTKGRPPSDRWFAEIDSKTDQRRHAGGPKPWAPGERKRLLQTPFHPDELASRQIREHPSPGGPGSDGITERY